MSWVPEWVTLTDGDDTRAHAVEPDAVGAFFCGVPPPTATQRPAIEGDDMCLICVWLTTPMMQAAVAEGHRLRASKRP